MNRVTFIEVFSSEPFGGATVAVVHGDPGDRAQRMAAGLGCAATVFVLPARRDDCGARAKVLTPRRELPLSVGAAMAVAEALGGDALSLELGVTRTDLRRVEGTRWSVSLARPVLGTMPLHDRSLAAAAVGLDATDLVDGLPVLSASCGVPWLVFPLRSQEALQRAEVDSAPWRRLVEKAKPYGAVLLVPTGQGVLSSRAVLPGGPDDLATGFGGAVSAVYLWRYGVRPAGVGWPLEVVASDGVRRVLQEVTVEGLGDRDGGLRVSGEVVRIGEATFWG